MPKERCCICRKFLSSTESAICDKCELRYHKTCVALPVKSKVPPMWHCPKCRKEEKHNNNDDDTLVQVGPKLVEKSSSTVIRSCSESTSDVEEPTIKDIMREIRALRIDFLDFRKDISDIKMEMQTYKDRIEYLEVQAEALENYVITEGRPHHSELDNVIQDLKSDLNERDQELLSNDLEIRNIPEEEKENPAQVVVSIAAKLGVNIDDRDIVSAERIGGSITSKTTESQPRPILVRLVRRDIRNDLFAKARIHRNITTRDLGFSREPHRFYINERLTKMNRALFRQAREVGRQNGWQFIWTRRGRILARRKLGEPVLRIKYEKDITESIGTLP